jgi:hypothetical protein
MAFYSQELPSGKAEGWLLTFWFDSGGFVWVSETQKIAAADRSP